MQQQARFCLHPCRCGYHVDAVKECTCSFGVVSRYHPHLTRCAASSCPLLDQMDTRSAFKSPVSRPARKPDEKLSDARLGDPSTAIQSREEAGHYLGVSNLAGAGARLLGSALGGPTADHLSGFGHGEGYFAIFGCYGTLFLLSSVSLKGVSANSGAG
jgi:hypothetical protein